MSGHSIRFGVRAPSGHHAATWKVWTPVSHKNDVYLACRSLGGELKASLHESGQWHVAFSPRFFDREFSDEEALLSRFTDKWTRPPEIGPGVTLAYRIVVPWFSSTIPIERVEKDVFWVLSAPEGQAIHFAILITSPSTHVSNWPSKNSMSSKLISMFPPANGDTVWVVYTLIPFSVPETMRGKAKFFKGHDPASLTSESVRAVIFGDEPDGSRTMYDVPGVSDKRLHCPRGRATLTWRLG